MATPLLRTKLYVPPVRPELMPRPRLVDRLGEGMTHKLTLISAPAGFGKTTLVTEWLSRVERPFTWLSLDEGDNDPVRFLTYLIAALEQVDERIGQTARDLMGAPQLPAVDVLMTTLINDLAATAEPFVLVLDDYQLIDADWVHQAVDFLITHQPPQVHLVIITRHDPPLPLPRLRVRGQVTEIRVDDLRFTADEVAAFLDRAWGLALDADVVAALEARTEGWVAALQLAALSMRAKSAAQIADFVEAFSGSHRHLIDYLADEVLTQQPDEIRAFLRQTAILDRLTAPLCDAISGRDDSERLLRQLEQSNLFLLPLDDQREWYRYHRLFADYLRTELDPECRSALHLRAARWLADHDLIPEAVKHTLAAGDMDEAARLILLTAGQIFRIASPMTLLDWLNALPEEMVRGNGELSTYKGLVLFLTDSRAEATVYADAAERGLPPDAPPPSRGRLLALKAHLALQRNAWDSAVQLAREALDLLGDSDILFRDLTSNVLGQALEAQGDIAAAVDVYRDAVLIGQRAGNQLGAIVSHINLVIALNELGQRREAAALCQQVLEEGSALPRRRSVITETIYLVCGVLAYEGNEIDLAQQQLLRALQLFEQLNITAGIVLGQYVLARVHWARGEVDTVLRICREARQHTVRLGLDALQGAWFAALEAQVRLHHGDLAAAASWGKSAALSPSDVPHHWQEWIYFTYVRLLLAQNRPEDAQEILATMERSARQAGRRRKLITILLQQGLVQQALGQRKQALACIEEALQLAAPEGYRRAFLDEGSAILDLLPQVRHVAPDFVDQVLNAAGLEPALPRAMVLVEPLTERELEILRLIAAGRSNPEIADRLYLSLNTIKWHVKNLYGKLQAGNRVEAVARARELDLI